MSLLDEIKSAAKEQGGDRAKIMYWKDGDKKRIRFLNDLEDGIKVVFHNSFKDGINVLCQKMLGKECPYCNDERVKEKKQFAWSVYDYDSEDVKIFMFTSSSKCSPVLNLASLYEDYGTLTDRDYNIKREGKGLETNYSVIPLDKKKFLDSKAKPYTKKSLLAILDKAYPADEETGVKSNKNNNDEEEVISDGDLPFNSKPSKTAVKVKEISDDEIEISADDDDEEIKIDYSEMSAKELYKLCCKRGIIVEPKRPAKLYIEELEKWDNQQDDWGEDE